MEDWQQRVIEEKAELDARLIRLHDVIASERFKTFDLLQQDLMKRQAGYMDAYSLTLRDRIEGFK